MRWGSVLGIALLLASCVPPPVLDLSRPIDPSLPVAELDVQPLLDAQGVRVGIGVWHPSLQFEAADEAWTARYDVVLRAWKRDGRRIAAEQSNERIITVDAVDATTTLQSDPVALTLNLKPGTYWITATVRDQQARTESVTGAIATVVERATPYRVDVLKGTPLAPVFSRTLLADGQPVHVRIRTDARAAFQVEVARAELALRPASPPAAGRVSPSPLTWEPVAAQRSSAETPEVDLDLGALAEGAYRWQVRAGDRVVQSGTWVVRDVTFPVVTEWAEMVAALSYIATPNEVAELQAAPSSARRAVFDTFWQAGTRSRAEATEAVQVFAERLEAANLRFSQTRSGWQTDRGMMHIVFGPPFFIDRDYNSEVWQYRLDPASDRVTSFVFTRNTETGRWHLRRDPSYAALWDAAVQRWRTGRVQP
ncbi:MAG: hypothetical protein RhofKO_24810 [Rhodothermales bacterium]